MDTPTPLHKIALRSSDRSRTTAQRFNAQAPDRSNNAGGGQDTRCHELIDVLWRELRERCRDPVRVEVVGGVRIITYLSLWQLCVDEASCRIESDILVADSSVGAWQSAVTLDPMDWDWQKLFVAQCLAIGLVPNLEPSERESLADKLSRKCRKHRLLFRLSVLSQTAIGLDNGLLELALRARWSKRRGVSVPLTVLNVVWKHKQQFAQLAQENSGLLRVYCAALLAGQVETRNAPYRELRQACRRVGLTARCWKMIAKWGDRMFDVVWQDASPETPWDRAVNYALRLQKITVRQPPPKPVMHALLQDYVDPNGARITFSSYFESIPVPFLRMALREAERLQYTAVLGDFIRNELLPATEFLCGCAENFDRNQQRAGWRWLMRQCAWWYARRAAEELAVKRRWVSKIDNFQLAEFYFVALTDSYMLWDEGCVLRHCAATYAEACLRGDTRVFSIRTVADNRRVATLALVRERGQWSTTMVRGFANTTVTRRVLDVADEFARVYDRA